jgi:hypothetical protein
VVATPATKILIFSSRNWRDDGMAWSRVKSHTLAQSAGMELPRSSGALAQTALRVLQVEIPSGTANSCALQG